MVTEGDHQQVGKLTKNREGKMKTADLNIKKVYLY